MSASFESEKSLNLFFFFFDYPQTTGQRGISFIYFSENNRGETAVLPDV